MSIRHCLDSAVAQKEITQAAADELATVYEKFRAQHALIHGDAEARRLAAEQLAKRLEGEAVQRRRAALLQASTIEARWNDLAQYKNARGEVDAAKGLLDLMETHGRRDVGLASASLFGLDKAIFSTAVQKFEGELSRIDKDWLGRPKDKATGDAVVRELHGQDSGNAYAKGVARVFADIAEGLRQRFNEGGGAIGKLEGWALPQSHSADAIRRAGFDTWAKAIDQHLDWDRMRHSLSGDPILPGERMDLLKHVADTILSDGVLGTVPSTQPQGRGALYKQHSDHRFLIFKDADAWLAYARDFGQPDVLTVMGGYIKRMSRDIAAMQLLGPNPQATLNWLTQKIAQEAAKADRGEAALVPRRSELLGVYAPGLRTVQDRVGATLHRVESMWQLYSGAADVAVDNFTSSLFGTAKNVITAASLGSAILSAPSDQGFGAMARKFATGTSITRGVLGQLGTVVQSMVADVTGRGESTRGVAIREGIIFDHIANAYGERAREASAFSGPMWSRYLADQVLRKQGLVHWTDYGKGGFGLHFMGKFADEARNAWGDMNAALRGTLQRYGFDAAEWDILRQARRHDLSADGSGALVLRAREIAALTIDDLALHVVRNEDLAGHARAELKALEGLSERDFQRRLRGDEWAERPRWMQDLMGVGHMPTLAETRAVLQRLVDQPGKRDPMRLEGAGSIPSDAVDVRVKRYFRDLSERYQQMILQETTYAVPEAIAYARSLSSEIKRGTPMGEVLRSWSQFKGFGMTVAMLYGNRIANEMVQGRVGLSSLPYAATALAVMSVYGMLSLQLKQLAKGEDTRDMGDWRTWAAAMVQSGGFGIYGDFFLADQNRLGGGLASTFAGPLIGRAERAVKVSIGNVQQGADDKRTNWRRELLGFADTFNPLSSLWWSKLAWDRVAKQQLQRVIDPEAYQAWGRLADTARRDRGVGMWWRHGELAPSRPPEMGQSRGR